MKYISSRWIPIVAASILASCSFSPKSYHEGTVSLMLYRPVDFNGYENLYVDSSKVLKGVSNKPIADPGMSRMNYYKDQLFGSLGMAIKQAIEKEGPYCMGLANVKITRSHAPGMAPHAVEGNPVYRKR